MVERKVNTQVLVLWGYARWFYYDAAPFDTFLDVFYSRSALFLSWYLIA